MIKQVSLLPATDTDDTTVGKSPSTAVGKSCSTAVSNSSSSKSSRKTTHHRSRSRPHVYSSALSNTTSASTPLSTPTNVPTLSRKRSLSLSSPSDSPVHSSSSHSRDRSSSPDHSDNRDRSRTPTLVVPNLADVTQSEEMVPVMNVEMFLNEKFEELRKAVVESQKESMGELVVQLDKLEKNVGARFTAMGKCAHILCNT